MVHLLVILGCVVLAVAAVGGVAESQEPESAKVSGSVEHHRFADAIHDELIPYAEQLPEFAGAWLDRTRSGELVINLTNTRSAQALRDRLPSGGTLRVESVAFTRRQLRDAATAIARDWRQGNPNVPFYAIAVQTDTNDLRIEVPEGAEDLVDARWLSSVAGQVPYVVIGARADHDAACTGRDSCTSPMRAGIRIRKGSPSQGICTMGWHAEVTHFLTAGHCGFDPTMSNNWYHDGYGLIGSEQATLYSNGVDAMRVRMPPSQMSQQLYGWTGSFSGARNPALGEDVCASLGNSNQATCGGAFITDDDVQWISDACHCLVWGADIGGMAIYGGDSGSPVMSANGSPIGLINTSGGKVARLGEVLYGLGQPFGNLELATRVPGYIRVAGWAIDPDSTGAIAIHVYVDVTGYNTGNASLSRPDVASVYPAYGQYHGFDKYVAVGPGPNNVCVYAINTSWGSHRLLACTSVP